MSGSKITTIVSMFAFASILFLGFTGTAFAASHDADKEQQCLEIYPYLGVAIDNFASADSKDYFNPEDTGDSETRETFGIWFQYPLGKTDNLDDKNCDTIVTEISDSDGNVASTEIPASIWLYGQTARGVRSAEVDCSNSTDGICADAPGTKSLGILRDASSLEAMLGVRWEFHQFPNDNAAWYTNLQLGFVAVDDAADDVAEVSHIGLGARIISGVYRNSYIEFGLGKNDLINDRNTDRIKVNARLVKKGFDIVSFGKNQTIGFIHLSVDVDGHSGPDSIQTYIGIAY